MTVIAIRGGDLVEVLRKEGIEVRVTTKAYSVDETAYIGLPELVKKVEQADGVHLLGYWNFLTIVVATLARILRKTYVLCPAGEFAALEKPRPRNYLFHQLFGKAVIRNASALLAITELERRQFAENFRLPTSAAVVVPNGIAPSVQTQEILGLPGGPFVLFVGRLAMIKGPDLLVSAFDGLVRRGSSFDLVIAGPDFGLREKLVRQVADSGLRGRVHFLGFVNERERLWIMQRAKLLCVPSRSEAMSLVALEGAASGLPVLLTNQCGFDDLAEKGGAFVVNATAEGILEGLIKMTSDLSLLKEMGIHAQEYILSSYRWSNIAVRLVEILARKV